MKKLLSLLFLLLPVASFAEETADDMTTIFEEHFDGWLYPHESGMNAKYEYKTSDISMQTYEAYNIPPNKLPCLRFAKLSSSETKIIISNFTGAYGKFILSYKSYNASFSVNCATDKDKKIEIKSNSDGTFTFNVQPNRSQIILSFNNDGSSVAMLDDIIVKAPTSSITTSPDAELSFKQQEMSATVGTTYNSSQLLSNPNSLPIKWYSSNQATATVDLLGNVTPHFIGTTTIYAIFEGNNDYDYQAVSYQLTTRREPLNNEVYYDGFADYNGIEGNGGILVKNEYEGDYKFHLWPLVSNSSANLYKGYQCLKIVESYIIKNLEKYGLKNFRLNFKYALSEESSKPSKTQVTVTLKYSDNSTSKVLDKMKWTDISVPISSASQLSSIKFSGNKFFIDEISIISEDFITIGSTGYATLYYSGRAIKIPTGLTAYTMKVENGKIVKSRAYSEGETLPKATAVILRGKPGKYNLDTSTEEGITDSNNQLKGSDTKTSTTGNDGDYFFYMLANKDGEGVGFYWGAKNGAAFLNGEHKAYLAIPKTDTYGSAAKPCYVFAEDAATAIGKTNDNETKPASYTLDGRLCPRGAKGIVISNGRKTIRR